MEARTETLTPFVQAIRESVSFGVAVTIDCKAFRDLPAVGRRALGAVHVSVVTGGQSYSLSNCTIDVLVDLLGNGLVDRPVIDKTQLTAKYDFRLAAMPDFMGRNPSDPADLSPFTAIQDLGLRLQAQTAYSGDVNGRFRRDVNKVGACDAGTCNDA